MLNVGYLKSEHHDQSDEWYTPDFAVKPLIKFLKQKKFKTIWCPFDNKNSEYVKLFNANGFKVVYTHKNDQGDFFQIQPPKDFDIIVSNPPFSQKDAVLQKCYELNKPFALLLPLPTLQSIKRFEYFQKGLEILVFDRRISFKRTFDGKVKNGNCFASIYFCKDLLPEKLMFERLND